MPSTQTDRLNGLTTSVAVKAPVRIVTNANITLSGEQTVNGVAVVDGDRVLVKDQTAGADNGIYVVSTSAWQRSADFDGNADVVQGTLVVSTHDTTIFYRVTTANPITIGTTSLAFTAVTSALTQAIIGAVFQPQTAAEVSAGVTPVNYYWAPGVIDRYATNTTPGTTDMTTAFDAACKSTATVRGIPGSTYLVTGVTATTARQLFDLTGCEFKLANATNAIILTLSGAGSVVRGGRFNGNKANQSGTGANQYGHAAVRINADYCIVEEIESYDSFGLGVKGTQCNYATIRNNKFIDPELYGVYVEGTTADSYGNEILDNYVTSTSLAAASGIYLTGSNSPFTYKQYLWKIRGNTCRGATSSPTGVGITTRAVDGVVGDNLTTGYTMGISADIATRTVITGNRCSDMAGSSGYGIEIVGGYCNVVGNVIKGGTYGIVCGSAAVTTPNIMIANNLIDEPSTRCIYVNAATQASQFLNIHGNTFIFSGAGTNRSQVYLAGDCKYSTISGNNFNGPGSGISGSRGVYLDTVVSHVSIIGNRFNGLERPVALYHASATDYTNISFIGNDCSRDMNADSSFLNLEGSAAYGAGIVQAWNVTSTGFGQIYLDRDNSILMNLRSGTPEANLTAGIGSLCMRSDGGASTTLYIKESGTGNTGWRAV